MFAATLIGNDRVPARRRLLLNVESDLYGGCAPVNYLVRLVRGSAVPTTGLSTAV